MFRDYVSTAAELRKLLRKDKQAKKLAESRGIDMDSYESIYDAEFKATKHLKDPFIKMRLVSELLWFKNRRPYFNVYPVIETKLLEIDAPLRLDELFLPSPSLEIRTSSCTFLMNDAGKAFGFVVELGGGRYCEFVLFKEGLVNQIANCEYKHIDSDWPAKINTKAPPITEALRRNVAMIACGVCLLAKDPSIVVPVVLNKHRKDDMTPDEMEIYKQKAIDATDKTGWEVGRDMQLRQSSCHYRNGCFAKYYVTKSHQQYPENCDLQRAPIIKWRSGAVVNANNTPNVPTGFKDAVESNVN